MENDKSISLTNLFQHLLSAEIYVPYLVLNLIIKASNKLTVKCLLAFSHYTRPQLEYGG